jgi:maleylpyruvate isomerase
MDVPTEEIAGCRAAHARLREAVTGLTDDIVRRPSLLPGWSVGHVLTHLARNADSVVRRLDGARRGEVVDQYVGGFEGRAAEIEEGAGRSADALIADVVSSSDAVDEAIAHFPADAWGRSGRGVGGHEQPVAVLPFQRQREVEVHLVDLGLGCSPSDWPDDLVARWLPELLANLPRRGDAKTLMAWALGRGDAPELAPY